MANRTYWKADRYIFQVTEVNEHNKLRHDKYWSGDINFFDTKEEAVKYKIDKARETIKAMKAQITHKETALQKFIKKHGYVDSAD